MKERMYIRVINPSWLSSCPPEFLLLLLLLFIAFGLSRGLCEQWENKKLEKEKEKTTTHLQVKNAAATRMTPKRRPKMSPRIPPSPILAVSGAAVTCAHCASSCALDFFRGNDVRRMLTTKQMWTKCLDTFLFHEGVSAWQNNNWKRYFWKWNCFIIFLITRDLFWRSMCRSQKVCLARFCIYLGQYWSWLWLLLLSLLSEELLHSMYDLQTWSAHNKSKLMVPHEIQNGVSWQTDKT